MIVKVRFNFEEHIGEGPDAQTAFNNATKVMLSQLPPNPEGCFYTTMPNESQFGTDGIRAMKVIRVLATSDIFVRADDFEFPFFVKVE